MTEDLTDLLGEPAEMIQARTPEPRLHRCPRCLTMAESAGRFFLGVMGTDGRAQPFCSACVGRHAPNLGKTVEALNLLAVTLGELDQTNLMVCNNALHFMVREAFAAMPPRVLTEEAHDAVARAVRAMIARQAHGITDISVIETVDVADVYAVIESLATIIGGPVREYADGDVSGWLQRLFGEDGEDGDDSP
jgi:hypothetical protein